MFKKEKREMQSSSKEVEYKICMSDIMGVKRPLKESCFSEIQINLLFDIWKQFMTDKFSGSESEEMARFQIDKLYNYSTSVEKKYNALRLDENTGVEQSGPALEIHESNWVMNSDISPSKSTPFIDYLRQRSEVMDNLRMSFKPVLNHRGALETADMLDLLRRFKFWINVDGGRQLNILWVGSVYGDSYRDPSDSSDRFISSNMHKNAVKSLQRTWSEFRFHISLLEENGHWYAVLIDRVEKSFEFYDPSGDYTILQQTSTMVGRHVQKLYVTALSLQKGIMTKTMKLSRRGHHLKSNKARNCGMFSVLFIFERVVRDMSYEDFANTDIEGLKNCKDLRDLFFTVKDQSSAQVFSHKKDPRMKFGAYEYRLAIIEFVRYINYIVGITRDDETRKVMKDMIEELQEIGIGKSTYYDIRSKGIELQQELMQTVPEEFKSYFPTDIWFRVIQQVIQDPFTIYLRSVSSSGKALRSHGKVRRNFALKVYRDIVGWRDIEGAPTEKINMLDVITSNIIDTVYIPYLSFSPDNKQYFTTGMTPDSFLMRVMSRQETVSFGVHFLREVDNWVSANMGYENNEMLNDEYPRPTTLTKPFTSENMGEISDVINKCEATIREAQSILQESFTERLQVKSLKDTSPLVGVPESSLEFPRTSSKLDRIIYLNETSLMNKSFLKDSKLEPFNFPIQLSPFQTNHPDIILSSGVQQFGMTESDMGYLITSERFSLNLGVGLGIVIDNLNIVNNKTLWVVAESLMQFYHASDVLSYERAVVCNLIGLVYENVKKFDDISKRFVDITDRLSKYVLYCKDVSEEFQKELKEFMEKLRKRFERIDNS
jgi:hypothetical protein